MSTNIKVGTGSGAYSGNVKLTLKKGSTPYKTIRQHNEGTVAFFTYIMKVIRGDVLPSDRPAYVKLVYKISETEERVSKFGILYSDVPKVESYSGEFPKATMTYSFIIPETVVEIGSIKGLQLESGNKVIYARVDFPEVVTVDHNTNIELDWELNICNYIV